MELSVKETHTLIAPCVSCQCNNHSETCDPETGKCLVCTITHFSIGFSPEHTMTVTYEGSFCEKYMAVLFG